MSVHRHEGNVIVQLARCSGDCCRNIVLAPDYGDDVVGRGFSGVEVRRAGKAVERANGGRMRSRWRDRFDTLRGSLLMDMDLVRRAFVYVGLVPGQYGPKCHTFACKHHDETTGNCGIHDQRRPHVCTSHGIEYKCDKPGCTMRVQVNPLVVVG